MGLALVALLLSALPGMALGAQNPPADQKPPSPSGAPSSAQKTPAQPSQAPPEGQKPPSPSGAPSSAQKAPAQPPQNPPEAPPPKLQLETPQAAPAQQKAPELTTPVAPAQPQVQPAAQQTIQDIIFRGNRRITSAVMRARIFSKKDDVYNESALRRDFMALWNTGYFDDIRLEVADSRKGRKDRYLLRARKEAGPQH